jgi:hypothetical protein
MVTSREFNLPHNICCEDGWVYVADRENHRVQIFDGQGKYETEWRDLHRPSALFVPRNRYVGEVAKTGWGKLFPGVTPEKPRAALQKLVKLD